MRSFWIPAFPKAIAALLVLGYLAGVSTSANARPPYLKGMGKTYPGLKNVIATNKCGMCHPMKNKKIRNNYGMAFGKALGAKNVKVPKQVTAALKKIEPEPSAIKGKTFGDLIRMGKHPASTK